MSGEPQRPWFHVKRRGRLLWLPVIAGTLALACQSFDTADGWASPQVFEDGDRALIIHATGEDSIVAIDPGTGESVWEFPDPDSDGRFPGLLPDIDEKIDADSFYAEPLLLAGEELAVATHKRGRVYALRLDGTSARLLMETGSEIVSELNLDAAGVLYVTTATAGVFAIDPALPLDPEKPLSAGEQPGLLWQYNAFDGTIWGSPALADTETHGQILLVPTLGGTLYALRTGPASGTARLAWTFEADAGIGGDIVVADGRLFIGSFDRHLYAIDVESGAELWRHRSSDWFWTEVLVTDGTVYAGDLNGYVWALDAATGAPRWDAPYAGGDDFRAKPGLTADGAMLIVVDRDGFTHAIDRESGSGVWVQPREAQLPDLFYANPLVLGSEIFVANEAGELFRVSEDAVELFYPPD